MAKITRYTGNLQPFAVNASGTHRTIFGGATQSDTLNANLNVDFLVGWENGVDVNGFPPEQYFNATTFTATQLSSYLFQTGIAEWDNAQEYNIGSLTNVAGIIYKSLTDANIGNTPASSTANWTENLGSLLNSGWSSAVKVVGVDDFTALAQIGDDTYICHKCYYDGATWRRSAASACFFQKMTSTGIIFYYGSNGAADSVFTPAQHFNISGSNYVEASGFTGPLTGNASTATTLQTARNIGGVSFNGSANINLPGVNAIGNQDTSGNAATATAAGSLSVTQMDDSAASVSVTATPVDLCSINRTVATGDTLIVVGRTTMVKGATGGDSQVYIELGGTASGNAFALGKPHWQDNIATNNTITTTIVGIFNFSPGGYASFTLRGLSAGSNSTATNSSIRGITIKAG